MNTDWIMSQISHINIPTVLASIGGSWVIRELVDWLKRRNLQTWEADMHKKLQSQKAEIDHQLEITKTGCQRDIQTHYLQTQLKTASLYKAYPELHWALKEAEGSVYQLFYHSTGRQDETYRVWCALTKKLAEHTLFLNDTLRDACTVAKDLLMEGIRSYASMDDATKEALMDSIHEKVNVVTNLMRVQLLEDGVELPSVPGKVDVPRKEHALL
jgi:hypothetical protein